MSDTPEKDFDEFADAMEATLTRFSERIQGFQTELDKMRVQQRSAVVTSPMDVVDMQEIVTRAAALIPRPENGKDGRDGKDGAPAVLNMDDLITRFAPLAADEVMKRLPPTSLLKGERGDTGLPGEKGERGDRGEDGLSAPDEIRSFIAEDRALQWREFFMGVYRPDTEYQRGQGVTWNGSFWIAVEDTRSKPETDKSWILVVKHGRDARK